MMNAKIVALLPMRHNSERIPGKNYRQFAGLPLYQHILNNLLACEAITEVVIDTDSPTILEQVNRKYPQVRLIERPKHLRAGTTAMNDVLLSDIAQVEADFYLQTHSTNPLLKAETIVDAINVFLNNYPMYDSLFTVTRLQTRLWDPLARAINHNPAILLRTQDLPPVYMENSCLYIFSGEILKNQHNRIGKRPYMYELDPIESQDIDEPVNFTIAELLYKQRQELF